MTGPFKMKSPLKGVRIKPRETHTKWGKRYRTFSPKKSGTAPTGKYVKSSKTRK